MTKVTAEGLLDGSGDPAWSKLLDDNAVSVKIEESPKESSTSSDQAPPGMPVRKESIFNSFHRQLRMSLKAVSESPGPISRYSRSVWAPVPRFMFSQSTNCDDQEWVSWMNHKIKIELRRHDKSLPRWYLWAITYLSTGLSEENRKENTEAVTIIVSPQMGHVNE